MKKGFIQVLPLLLLAAFAVTTLVIVNRVGQPESLTDPRSRAAVTVDGGGGGGCSPRGGYYCSGRTRYYCSVLGSSSFVENCLGTCSGGGCSAVNPTFTPTPSPAPQPGCGSTGQTRCVSNRLQVCDGSTWRDGGACPTAPPATTQPPATTIPPTQYYALLSGRCVAASSKTNYPSLTDCQRALRQLTPGAPCGGTYPTCGGCQYGSLPQGAQQYCKSAPATTITQPPALPSCATGRTCSVENIAGTAACLKPVTGNPTIYCCPDGQVFVDTTHGRACGTAPTPVIAKLPDGTECGDATVGLARCENLCLNNFYLRGETGICGPQPVYYRFDTSTAQPTCVKLPVGTTGLTLDQCQRQIIAFVPSPLPIQYYRLDTQIGSCIAISGTSGMTKAECTSRLNVLPKLPDGTECGDPERGLGQCETRCDHGFYLRGETGICGPRPVYYRFDITTASPKCVQLPSGTSGLTLDQCQRQIIAFVPSPVPKISDAVVCVDGTADPAHDCANCRNGFHRQGQVDVCGPAYYRFDTSTAQPTCIVVPNATSGLTLRQCQDRVIAFVPPPSSNLHLTGKRCYNSLTSESFQDCTFCWDGYHVADPAEERYLCGPAPTSAPVPAPTLTPEQIAQAKALIPGFCSGGGCDRLPGILGAACRRACAIVAPTPTPLLPAQICGNNYGRDCGSSMRACTTSDQKTGCGCVDSLNSSLQPIIDSATGDWECVVPTTTPPPAAMRPPVGYCGPPYCADGVVCGVSGVPETCVFCTSKTSHTEGAGSFAVKKCGAAPVVSPQAPASTCGNINTKRDCVVAGSGTLEGGNFPCEEGSVPLYCCEEDYMNVRGKCERMLPDSQPCSTGIGPGLLSCDRCGNGHHTEANQEICGPVPPGGSITQPPARPQCFRGKPCHLGDLCVGNNCQDCPNGASQPSGSTVPGERICSEGTPQPPTAPIVYYRFDTSPNPRCVELPVGTSGLTLDQCQKQVIAFVAPTPPPAVTQIIDSYTSCRKQGYSVIECFRIVVLGQPYPTPTPIPAGGGYTAPPAAEPVPIEVVSGAPVQPPAGGGQETSAPGETTKPTPRPTPGPGDCILDPIRYPVEGAGWCDAAGVRCRYRNARVQQLPDPWCDLVGTPANTCVGPDQRATAVATPSGQPILCTRPPGTRCGDSRCQAPLENWDTCGRDCPFVPRSKGENNQ